MPLEDLVGNKYIDDLNASWPLGSDKPDAGDDHIRGIKNVLRQTFPNLSGPITLTQDEINIGVVSSGAVMVFYNSAAPVGWTRVTGITETFSLRVVPTANSGGGWGGSDNPILNDKVPMHTHSFSSTSGSTNVSHTHTVSGTSGNQSQNHTHGINLTSGDSSTTHTHGFSATTDWEPDHQHALNISTGNGTYRTVLNISSELSSGGGLTDAAGGHNHTVGGTTGNNNVSHAHAVTGTSGSNSVGHTHAFSATSSSSGGSHTHSVSGTTAINVSSSNWAPRYRDVILCEKD